ncbi:maleylacetoacetate isomerase [Agarilytica rhodophyticola]|uniref:maleylacetoacetate isomerase n=1 Tax=Agarilytica rhodophyticola TaxID=1737490 RepID=UPI000B341C52|nr:maleylacetoacetate isomerase [Agarilytica rhodophyticola]
MPTLYTYFRSSSSYRIRIALHLKNIACDYCFVNIHPDTNEQKNDDYLAINPQGRVPFFIDGDLRIAQSTAILEYLEEAYTDKPLLPKAADERAWIRQLINVIACDIQPLNNIAVLGKLKKQFSAEQADVQIWYEHWVTEGFSSLESMLQKSPYFKGDFCHGVQATLADVYLIPQIWNARRFNVPLDKFPTLLRIEGHCNSLDAFFNAAPAQQEDCNV